MFIPQGMGKGFIAVAVSYVLDVHGVSVPAIAVISGLYLTPMTWGLIAGPVIDATLGPRPWLVIGATAASLAFAAFGLIARYRAQRPPSGPWVWSQASP